MFDFVEEKHVIVKNNNIDIIDKELILDIKINNNIYKALIDTGASKSLLSINVINNENYNNLLDYNENGSIEMINSSINIIAKILNLKILIGNIKTYISPYIIDNLPFNIILGRDFLIKNNTIINFKNSNIIISGRLIEY